jgi:hypothetical protein
MHVSVSKRSSLRFVRLVDRRNEVRYQLVAAVPNELSSDRSGQSQMLRSRDCIVSERRRTPPRENLLFGGYSGFLRVSRYERPRFVLVRAEVRVLFLELQVERDDWL